MHRWRKTYYTALVCVWVSLHAKRSSDSFLCKRARLRQQALWSWQIHETLFCSARFRIPLANLSRCGWDAVWMVVLFLLVCNFRLLESGGSPPLPFVWFCFPTSLALKCALPKKERLGRLGQGGVNVWFCWLDDKCSLSSGQYEWLMVTVISQRIT